MTGRRIGSGSLDKTPSGAVGLWDAATMQPVGEPLTQEGVVTAIGFSRDGRMAATG